MGNYFRPLQAVLEACAICAAARQSVLDLYFDASNDPTGAVAWFGALELPVEPLLDPVPIELPGAVVPGAEAPGALVPGLVPVPVPAPVPPVWA